MDELLVQVNVPIISKQTSSGNGPFVTVADAHGTNTGLEVVDVASSLAHTLIE